MATPDVYHIPPTQANMNNPGEGKSDTNYVSASQPPTSYPMQPPPPYAALPRQQPMYQSHPMIVAPMQIPYQGVIVTSNYMHSDISHIRDYLIWSMINVFVGGFIFGIIAVLLSIQTRNRKLIGDIEGARSMSRVTFIFNILITVISFALTAFLIIYFVFFVSYVNSSHF